MDGFAVGIAYGINRIKIPLVSWIIIAGASVCAVTVSMICGQGLSAVLPESTSSLIGALILCGVGMFFFIKALKDWISKQINAHDELLTVNVKPLGIIIKILKQPSSADLDSSGEISPREAVFLGLALALDSLGAGAGAAMAGFNILVTAICVGVLQYVLINAGLFFASSTKSKYFSRFSSVIPGIIFFTIGIYKIINIGG